MKHTRVLFIMLIAGLLTALAIIPPALAHEGREVADGQFVIEFGWRMEPAYTTLYNGPEFTVEAHDSGNPIRGLEDTLQIEVLFGGRTKLLRLRSGDEPGHYTADLIPMRPGDYSFRIFGLIGENVVDEIFNAADGEFDSVNPIEDIQFP